MLVPARLAVAALGAPVAAGYASVVMAHADALRAAGVNGAGAGERGAIKSFVSAITDNALWLIGTVATLAILVIGGLFFFGHSPRRRLRRQDRRRRGDHRVGARHRRVERARAPTASPRSARARAATVARSRLAVVLARRAAWPAPANAADLFPVDDWLGDGIKKAGDVVLGPLKLGVEGDRRGCSPRSSARSPTCSSPRAWCSAGLDGIKWLVQLPPVGADATPQPGVPAVRMPHLQELRDTMTWIGVTLLPLGIVITAGRAFLAPTADGDSPAEVLGARADRRPRAAALRLGVGRRDRALAAAHRRAARAAVGRRRRRADARDAGDRRRDRLRGRGRVRRAADDHGRRRASLLGLLLVRVGLEVATALLYVLGGLVLGLSVTSFGRRLLAGVADRRGGDRRCCRCCGRRCSRSAPR